MGTKTIVALACALLLVLPSVTLASPASGLEVAIVGREPGERLDADGFVDVRIAGAPDGADVAGWIELDGETVGTFIRKAAQRDADVRVPINASRVPRGEHALVAHAFTDGIPPTASAPVAAQLNHPPRAEGLWASYDVDRAALLVEATLREDDEWINVTISSPLGRVDVTQAIRNGSGGLNVTQMGRLWHGAYPLRLDLTDSDGVARSAETTFQVRDRPSSVRNLTTWTVQGASMRLSALATDPDGPIERARLLTSYGSAAASVVDGAVNLTLDGLHLRLGEHEGWLELRDARGGTTYVAVTFLVEGTRRVLHEEVIEMSYGGRGSLLWKQLPTVRDATLSVCSEKEPGTCSRWSLSTPGGVTLRTHPYGTPVCRLDPVVSSNPCRFDTGAGGDLMELAWALAGQGRIRLVLEGTVLT